MGPLECQDCGATNTPLRAVREPHFGRFCLPCLAKREARANGSSRVGA